MSILRAILLPLLRLRWTLRLPEGLRDSLQRIVLGLPKRSAIDGEYRWIVYELLRTAASRPPCRPRYSRPLFIEFYTLDGDECLLRHPTSLATHRSQGDLMCRLPLGKTARHALQIALLFDRYAGRIPALGRVLAVA